MSKLAIAQLIGGGVLLLCCSNLAAMLFVALQQLEKDGRDAWQLAAVWTPIIVILTGIGISLIWNGARRRPWK